MLDSLYKENLDWENLNVRVELMETILSLNERSLDNPSNERKVREAEKSYEGLILKELPKHLKYAFLREARFKPVIIATELTSEK